MTSVLSIFSKRPGHTIAFSSWPQHRQTEDDRVATTGLKSFTVQGNIDHRIGPMQPLEVEQPKFAQIYCFNTEHELKIRCLLMSSLRPDIVVMLQDMPLRENRFVREFKAALTGISPDCPQAKMCIFTDGKMNVRRDNAPTASEVAAVMHDDREDNSEKPAACVIIVS